VGDDDVMPLAVRPRQRAERSFVPEAGSSSTAASLLPVTTVSIIHRASCSLVMHETDGPLPEHRAQI